MVAFKTSIKTIDSKVSSSTFGRIFRLDGSGHPKARKNARFITEVRAGLTTFFTMAYIIAVNASILTDSGGTCECKDAKDFQCMNDPAYNQCLIELKRDFTTATAAIAGIGSFAFGFFTNLPVALAPGMGLNAYFTFQVVGFHGQGPVPYRLALTAVFIEGLVFVFLSLIGMRQWLVKIIPSSLKVASGVGIGLFLTETGLSYAGIGLITRGSKTPTDLGGCPRDHFFAGEGRCVGHRMTSPTLWIGIIFGGVFTAYLMAYRVKSAIIAGILLVSIISWPRNTPFTYFPHTKTGDDTFAFFKQIVAFHPLTKTLVAQDWDLSQAGRHFVLALFTFLYVDIIDCTATLYSMASFSGVVNPETGDFPRSTIAYCCDALTISISSLLGCSPVTAFIESGAGITEGGRTGLTSMTTGLCFLISIFFAPIFASIPPWATGCTLVLVGWLMMRQVTDVNWSFIGDALPAFVTIACMPFTYSVAYGLIAGLFTYAVLNGAIYVTKLVTRGRVQPPDADNAEYWTYRPAGSIPPWFIRAAQGKIWRFGRTYEVDEISDGSLAMDKELVEIVATRTGIEETTKTGEGEFRS